MMRGPGVMLLVQGFLALIFVYLNNALPPDTATRAKAYCGGANVASVNICNGYIEVVSSLLGGGSTYYSPDGSATSCPVVSLDYMSPECKAIFEAKLNSSFSCRSAC